MLLCVVSCVLIKERSIFGTGSDAIKFKIKKYNH